MKRPSNSEQLRRLARFNRNFPVGTPVYLKQDGKLQPVLTRVREEAFMLGGHTPVVFLDGISSCYDISRVSAAS